MSETIKKVIKKTKPVKKTPTKAKLTAHKKIKVLITIVDRNKSDFYLSALEGFDCNLQTLIYAKGTANKETLDLLGIENDKAIILSIVKEDKIKEIFNAYEDRYFKTKNGKGIAFTIPIDSVIGVMVYKFLLNMKES